MVYLGLFSWELTGPDILAGFFWDISHASHPIAPENVAGEGLESGISRLLLAVSVRIWSWRSVFLSSRYDC